MFDHVAEDEGRFGMPGYLDASSQELSTLVLKNFIIKNLVLKKIFKDEN